MTLFCTKCDAWVEPFIDLLGWHCPQCGDCLEVEQDIDEKDICAITGFTRKAVIEAIGYQGEVKERAKQLALLRKERPKDRSVAEHERCIAAAFPELVEI